MTSAPPEAPGSAARAELGLIGGSGFYSFFDRTERVHVDTPFGEPSDDIVVGTVGERTVAFLPRHGHDHRLPPHRINYRANLWALRSLGVRQVLSPCAVGSLVSELGPGTIVVPDQVIDRTWGREHTIYDAVGRVVHVAFADPFCGRGRATVIDAAGRAGIDVTSTGTLTVVNGPRFSSRAESRWHRASGATIVGMTAMPEAAIARELAMCFTTIALVTDHDAGVDGTDAVTHLDVMAAFAETIDTLKSLLHSVLPAMPPAQTDAEATCSCRRALDGLTLPFDLPR